MADLRYRSPELVIGILAAVYESPDPYPWHALVDLFSSDRHAWRTVEATIYDLVAFGALHKVGQPSSGRRVIDSRALKATPLGRAWLDGELLPTLNLNHQPHGEDDQ